MYKKEDLSKIDREEVLEESLDFYQLLRASKNMSKEDREVIKILEEEAKELRKLFATREISKKLEDF